MAYDFSTLNKRLGDIKTWLDTEYSSLRTGKANPGVLDRVMVDAYGSLSPIKNVAHVAIEDVRTLRVAPWDATQIKAIEKAIQTCDLGLSVVVDDKGLRIIFPELTGETREKLVKVSREKLEEAKISIRKERERVWDEIQKREKDGSMSEDEKFALKEKMQKIVDDANKSLEDTSAKKEADIRKV